MPPACMQKKLKLHSEQRRAEGEGGSDLGKKYLTQELNQDFHESLEQPNTAAAINKNKNTRTGNNTNTSENLLGFSGLVIYVEQTTLRFLAVMLLAHLLSYLGVAT